MLKKIIYLNIAVFILIFIAAIIAFYGYNYPTRFRFVYHFKDYGLGFISLILIGISLTAALVSSLDIKNLDFKNKFFRIILALNSLVLFFTIYEGLDGFLKNRKVLTDLENEYIQQAKIDIKNDQVTYRFAGGLALPMYTEKTIQKIDSVHHKYGVTYFNTGCILLEIENKAQEKYEITVKPYLEKRNGKDWESKMNNEIEKIKEKSLSGRIRKNN